MKEQDWNIRSRSENCYVCDRAFTDQEPFISQLTFGAEGYCRHDFCTDCWDKENCSSDSLSVWHSIFRLPPPPAEEPLKKETAETLLRHLLKTKSTEKQNTIYILAVMLERRRIFVEQEVRHQEGGAEIRVYEHKETGEVFLIPDPKLHLAELEHVQQEVIALLSNEDGSVAQDEQL